MVELRALEHHWRDALAESISERVHATGASATPAAAAHVLYWMRDAPRGHDNPALDAAIGAAEKLALPLYVFHGFSPQPALASPRRLDFALDAALDVSKELAERGIPYAAHVVKRDENTRPLAQLARRAALIVTELAPLEPARTWVQAFSALPVPLWCVDTQCVVPYLPSAPRAKAFHRYRDDVQEERIARTMRPWRNLQPASAYDAPSWPFEVIPLGHASRAALHAYCDFDSSEPQSLAGGARAGYELWTNWKQAGLREWPVRSADPDEIAGAHIAALLDAGHLSPFRLAREAALQGNAGAKRWLRDHILRADFAMSTGLALSPRSIDRTAARIPRQLSEQGLLPRAERWIWLRSLTRQVEPNTGIRLVCEALGRLAHTGPSLREHVEFRIWSAKKQPEESQSVLDLERQAP